MGKGAGVEKVLVTGSTGFIGKRLVAALQENGFVVRVFLRNESVSEGLFSESAEVVRGGYHDRAALAAAVEGVQRIIHLAGVTKAADEAGFDSGNVYPAEQMLEAVKRHNPDLKRFLLVSSLAAAGPAREGSVGLRESDAPQPVSAYGRSKLRGEGVCLKCAGSVSVTIIRPPAVYGPGDRDILQIFQMMQKGMLVSAGNASRQRFSMIYVDDLVAGIINAACAKKAAGRIYYLAAPRPYSWEDLIAAVKPAMGFRRLMRITLPKPLVFVLGAILGAIGAITGTLPLINRDKANELVQDFWVCSPDRAAAELGFHAETSLEEGVAKTVAWYRDKGWM